MKKIGIARALDDIGRLVIPMEIRKTHGWGPGKLLEIQGTIDGAIVRAYNPGCMKCGSEEYTEKDGFRLCKKCAREFTGV